MQISSFFDRDEDFLRDQKFFFSKNNMHTRKILNFRLRTSHIADKRSNKFWANFLRNYEIYYIFYNNRHSIGILCPAAKAKKSRQQEYNN